MDAPDARALVVRPPDMPPPDRGFQPVPDRRLPTLRRTGVTVWVLTGGRWLARQLVWSLDHFARWFVSGLVFLGLRWLFGHWWFPRELWDDAPTLAEGFEHARDVTPRAAEAEADDAEEATPGDEPPPKVFVMALDEGAGERLTFWRHDHRCEGQLWPCVLLFSHPCRRCEWFVPAFQGRPLCVGAERVRLRSHPQYRYYSLAQLREEIEAFRDETDPSA